MRNPTPKDEVPLLEASGNRVHAISTEPLAQSHGFSDVQKHLGGGPRQLAGSIRSQLQLLGTRGTPLSTQPLPRYFDPRNIG